MSERGSFVTEYIYCNQCLAKMKEVLLQDGKFLKGQQIEGWGNIQKPLPIIAGKIGGLGQGNELIAVEFNLFNSENAPCHPVRIAVLPESGDGTIFTVMPSGDVLRKEDARDGE